MTKVAHIVWGLETGGIETMLANIVNRQVASASVTLIVINDKVNKQLLERIDPRVNVVLLARKVGSHNPLPLIRLNTTLLRLRPTAIHCHSYTIANYLLPHLRRRSLLTIHTTQIGRMTRKPLLNYKRIYAISKAVQSMLKEQFAVDSKLIYNGIDFGRFAQRNSAERNGNIRIVQVGRLIPEKGHDLSLAALSTLKDKQWQFDIIGSGEQESHLKQLVEQMGLGERVQFLGNCSQEYLFENLCNYDILLQPSTVEGFGLTVVEAMAANVAVIASDVDGLSEVTEHGKHATLFQSENRDALATALERMLCEPIDEKYLYNVRSAAIAKFDICSTAKQYLTEYEDTANQ